MTDRRDPDHLIAAWLQDQAREVAPERLLAASRDRVQSTHQRRAWRPAQRSRPANSPIRLASAVAALAVLAVLGTLLLLIPGRVGTPEETPPSTAVPSVSEPTGTPAAAVAAGYKFTCALTTAGGVKCWGSNGRGQLGNGTTTDSIVPVDVAGLTTGVTSIALGFEQACALTSQGGVRCWGRNEGGQLGNGTKADSSIPVDVSGLSSGVTAIDAGGGWFCARANGGGASCWGLNHRGELGSAEEGNQSRPVEVVGLGDGVTAIAGGGGHTCAATGSGGVQCWGFGGHGELGNGELGNGPKDMSRTPVDVVGLSSGVMAIAAGDYYTCAVLDAGTVKCWGTNTVGQLGNGTTTNSLIPVDVTGLAGVTAIAASGSGAAFQAYHTCVIATAGGVKCWGLNESGQLGNGTTTNSGTPVDVTGLAGVATDIATGGGGHTCAVVDSGGIQCWGENDLGQLGDGTKVDSSIPVDVRGL